MNSCRCQETGFEKLTIETAFLSVKNKKERVKTRSFLFFQMPDTKLPNLGFRDFLNSFIIARCDLFVAHD
jgi:hypothetical protein